LHEFYSITGVVNSLDIIKPEVYDVNFPNNIKQQIPDCISLGD
jgi:hypothetical protein